LPRSLRVGSGLDLQGWHNPRGGGQRQTDDSASAQQGNGPRGPQSSSQRQPSHRNRDPGIAGKD